MTIEKFWEEVVARFGKGGERYGQAAFNLLCEVRPDLSEKIRGTENDPFYLERARGAKWEAFVSYLTDNW